MLNLNMKPNEPNDKKVQQSEVDHLENNFETQVELTIVVYNR